MIIPLFIILLGGGASLFFSEDEPEVETVVSVERAAGEKDEIEIIMTQPEEGEKVVVVIEKVEEEGERELVEMEDMEGLAIDEI